MFCAERNVFRAERALGAVVPRLQTFGVGLAGCGAGGGRRDVGDGFVFGEVVPVEEADGDGGKD